MRKKWKSVFVVGVAAALITAAAVLLLRSGADESIDKTVTFSDGTTMTLRAVTYSNEHRYLRGNLKERLVLMLPKKLRAKYASRSVMLSSRGALVFWLERRGSGPPNGDPQLVLCDSTGFGVCGGWSMLPLGPRGSSVEGWQYERWPRRDRTFTLRIYEPGKRYPDATMVGEFTIRNPLYRKYPVWDAPPPPVTARKDDMTVTLVDLVSGVGRGANKWKRAANPTVSTTRAGFRVEQNGELTTEWQVADIEMHDATGNVLFDRRSDSVERGLAYTELQPHLWPAESGWKLRMGFSRQTNFASSELWKLRVPLDGMRVTNTIEFTNGEGIVLRYLGQTRQRSFEEDHHFNFRVIPERNDYRVTLVSAIDDLGKSATGWPCYGSTRDWTFARDASTNATSMDLTVALHKTRYFDFLVRPGVVSSDTQAR